MCEPMPANGTGEGLLHRLRGQAPCHSRQLGHVLPVVNYALRRIIALQQPLSLIRPQIIYHRRGCRPKSGKPPYPGLLCDYKCPVVQKTSLPIVTSSLVVHVKASITQTPSCLQFGIRIMLLIHYTHRWKILLQHMDMGQSHKALRKPDARLLVSITRREARFALIDTCKKQAQNQRDASLEKEI